MNTITPKEKDKQYIFKITALVKNYVGYTEKKSYHVVKSKEMPTRAVALLGRQSLYKFAEAITYSFDFYFDHCFGFYSNVDSYYYHDSKVQYELFADLEDVEQTKAGSVKKTKVEKVWEKPGDKMTFLFDYGDGWRFLVELLAIDIADRKSSYPMFSEEGGTAPAQYPPEELLDVFCKQK